VWTPLHSILHGPVGAFPPAADREK
jgi:hypothetical protein